MSSEKQDRRAAEADPVDPLRQAESVQLHQGVLGVPHHGPHPGKTLQRLRAARRQGCFGPSDSGGEHSFQALGVVLAHAAVAQLRSGPCTTLPGLPSAQEMFDLCTPNGQARHRKAGDHRVSASADSTPHTHDANPPQEVVLVVAAVALKATRAFAGGTPNGQGRTQPPAPQLGGVIVFLRTVEYKDCVVCGGRARCSTTE